MATERADAVAGAMKRGKMPLAAHSNWAIDARSDAIRGAFRGACEDRAILAGEIERLTAENERLRTFSAQGWKFGGRMKPLIDLDDTPPASAAGGEEGR